MSNINELVLESFISDKLGNIKSAIGNKVTSIQNNIADKLENTGQRISDKFSNINTNIRNQVKDRVFADALEGRTGPPTAKHKLFSAIGGVLGGKALGISNALLNGTHAAVNTFAPDIAPVINPAIDFVNKIGIGPFDLPGLANTLGMGYLGYKASPFIHWSKYSVPTYAGLGINALGHSIDNKLQWAADFVRPSSTPIGANSSIPALPALQSQPMPNFSFNSMKSAIPQYLPNLR